MHHDGLLLFFITTYGFATVTTLGLAKALLPTGSFKSIEWVVALSVFGFIWGIPLVLKFVVDRTNSLWAERLLNWHVLFCLLTTIGAFGILIMLRLIG